MRTIVGVAVMTAMVAASVRSAQAESTQPYVVQPGDTCLGIAIRVLGARAAVRDIHRLNPQLGALPHDLAVGSVLTVPARAPSGPDARISRAQGDVKIRKPTTPAWDAAQRGMDLFRAYRVGAAAEASAELTFGDDALLAMRERTIVVIYGPEKRQAQVIHATAELERGTLAARLSDLDAKTLVIKTPAGEADVRAASVVVGSPDGGASTISNHRGKAVEVRGRTKRRTSVSVAAGMGSRVVPGQPPEPPRPLPATPSWSTPSGLTFVGTDGSLDAAWSAVERASQYRVAVLDPNGDQIRAIVIAAPAARVALALPPGSYQLTVSALDPDGLESAPSPVLAVQLIEPVFVSPSGERPAPGAVPPRLVTVGTTVLAPEGLRCSAGGAMQERTVLSQPGPVEVVCEAATGERSPVLRLEVVALPAAVSPPLEVRAPSTVAPVTTRPAGWRVEGGPYAGFHTLALTGRAALGAPGDPTSALDDGPTTGLRLALVSPRWGLEAEAATTWLDRHEVMGGSTALLVRSHAVLRIDSRGARARLLAGLGMNAADGDRAFVMSWGGAVGFSVGAIELRFDVRHELSEAAGGGAAHGLQATAGASIDVGM